MKPTTANKIPFNLWMHLACAAMTLICLALALGFFLWTGSSVALAPPTVTPVPAATATATATPTDLPSATATALPPPTATPTIPPTVTAAPTATPAVIPDKAFLSPMAHEYQKLNNCGPASLSAAAGFFGLSITQFDAAAVVKGGPSDKNVSPDEMVAYLQSLELEAVYRVNGSADLLRQLIANGVPVIAHQWLSRPEDGVLVGHYRVIRGYDRATGVFIASDPYTGPEFSIAPAQFEEWWRPFNRGYIPVYRLEQADLVAAILGPDWPAEENLRRALAQAQQEAEMPADGYAFFNLGDDYLALNDPQAAVEAYGQAFAFEFPEHFLWYQFGPLDAYNRAGQPQKTLNLSAEMIAQAGELEEARLQRGLAYLALQNPAAARLEIEKALAANPRFTPAQAALDALPADN